MAFILVYIDSGPSSGPSVLTVVTSGPSYPRTWNIRVMQIECEASYRAPDGCLQFFTGVSGTVCSFNFDGDNVHLAMQYYTICVRTERGFCGIAWMQSSTKTANSDPDTFLVSGQYSATQQQGTARSGKYKDTLIE